MTPAELKREAERRGILDKDDAAWFVENGAELLLFEELLRSRDRLEPGEFVVEGEPDHAAGWGTVLVWKNPDFKSVFEDFWPTSEARRKLLAAKAEQQAQQREQPASPERKGALSRQVEPPRDRPCWALQSLGMTRGTAKHMGGFKLVLREYEWVSGAWRRTKTPQERLTGFIRACEKADWIGRLPKMGRKRRAVNDAILKKAAPLFAERLSKREVGRRLGGLGRGSVDALYTLWQAGEVAK